MKNRFLRWLVLPALAIALTGTAQADNTSALRTVSLGWPTWTPQGATALVDTTFLSGATQVSDTTGSISTADWDFFPFSRSDINSTAQAPFFKLWVSGTFISTDSMFVIKQFSMDNINWESDGPTASAAASNQAYGTQQTLAYTPTCNFATTTDDYSGVTQNRPFPFMRFIVRVDGNTAARMTASRVFISYYRTGVNRPQFVWKKLKWLVSGQEGNTANPPTFKDTSSILISAPDTTQRVETNDWAVGPDGVAPFANTDSTGMNARIMIRGDASAAIDSMYVMTETSADGQNFTATPLILPGANGFANGITVAAGGAARHAGSNIGMIPLNTNRIYAATLFGSPFVRFRLYGSTGGVVVGASEIWVGYWRIPNRGF